MRIIIFILILPFLLFSATVYVHPDCTYTTISAGIAAMSGGDTLLVLNGIYSGSSNRIYNPPAGTPDDYTYILAETDFGVTIERDCELREGYDCVYIRGFKFFNYAANKMLIGSDSVKVIRCAFDGAAGNSACINFGQSYAAATGGNYCLAEDCYAFGGPMRYPFRMSSKSGSYTIFRRCLVRWDYSDTDEPQAAFADYDRPSISFQNCIAIDATDYRGTDAPYDGYKSFFTPNGANDVRYYGCISLNVEGAGYYIEDSPVQDIVLENCISWGCTDTSGGSSQASSETYDAWPFYSRGGDGPVAVKNCTIGANDYVAGVIFNGVTTDSIYNTIIYDIELGDGVYAENGAGYEDYNCFNSNTGGRDVSGGIGSNSITSDPTSNGLNYLPRIESGSTLKTAGSSGGQIGAQIVKRYGASETLWGETGWNVLQSDDLWPWPNQAQIKSDCASFYKGEGVAYESSPEMNGARGFAVPGKTLTNYIWDYLGNGSPYSQTQSTVTVTIGAWVD